jgi:hypothetical protein
MSPRTAKYVEAMIREGDNFDSSKWLKRVREEEAAQAKGVEATGTSGELAIAQINDPIKTSDDRHTRPSSALPLPLKKLGALRALHRPLHPAKSKTRKARLGRWLERIRGAWEDFQSSRRRDAVYGYLEAVFSIVAHFRIRRRTDRLLRHAFEFANLPCDKRTDSFAAVVRSTCDDSVDVKAISKWARALRYVARSKEPEMRLKTFMKEAGGINACATRYAKYFGRGRRR